MPQKQTFFIILRLLLRKKKNGLLLDSELKHFCVQEAVIGFFILLNKVRTTYLSIFHYQIHTLYLLSISQKEKYVIIGASFWSISIWHEEQFMLHIPFI